MRARVLCIAVVLAMAGPAMADWDVGDPYKWLQSPDLTVNGIDVNATQQPQPPTARKLADDFLCTSTELITDVHLWGSWKSDLLPTNGAGQVSFRLSIYTDIPASGLGTYSKPGTLLWSRDFAPGQFQVRQWAANIDEGWYDPTLNDYTFPGDHTAWQYNFYIPAADAFLQEGTTMAPKVYWLGVEAFVDDPAWQWGWKSSTTHWNDDATYIDPAGLWGELRYPQTSQLPGQSMDMAFVLTSVPLPAAAWAGLGLLGLLGARRLRKR